MKIAVGCVLKAQGIKGEVKCSCYLDNSTQIKHVKNLYLNNQSYEVKAMRCCDNFFYCTLDGVTDRNTAETLRNCEVYAEKNDVKVPDGHYFIEDVIGCKVTLSNGVCVGIVADVLQLGSADVYVVTNNGKELSFPLVKDLLIGVDVDKKVVTLNAERYDEVVVYDED